MKLKITLLCFTIFSFFIVNAQEVNIEGNPYGGNPYATISDAVNAANDGDVILISGLHTETVFLGKSVTLRGTNPTTDIIQAAASALNNGSGTSVINAVRLNASDVLNITIENLGIKHGNSSTNGGGIDIDKVTGLLTLKNLIIENNYTTGNGGGISIAGSNVDIIECTIQNNSSATQGGGIIAAPNNGAGINNVVNIRQSLINNNTALNGGGIYLNGNVNFGNDYTIDLNIENTTISNNTAASPSGGAGGGGIWSRSALWTTNAGGDGTSANTSLQLIHTTVYNNFHNADAKSGIQFTSTGGVNTNFSAYNSIIVAADLVARRAINFANSNTTDVVNCILGGLQNITSAEISILDDATKNNQRGRTATQAGLSGNLTDEGGNTQVITIGENSTADNFCTATVPVGLPSIDQRGFNRLATPDAGAYEFGGFIPVPCDAPVGLTTINFSATAVSFSWDSFVGADNGYEWAVVVSGGNPDTPADVVSSGSTSQSTENSTGATGLQDATNYVFYVRSVCGPSDFSDWSSGLAFTTAFQANLFLNSRFTDVDGNPSLDIENDGTPEWLGYGTNAEVDELIGENIGFLASTEGVLRQDFQVIPGLTYAISFNYRWVSESSTSDTNPPRTPVIRNDVDNSLIATLPAVETVSDTWFTYTYLYTHPTNLSVPTNSVRFQIFKANDNNQLNFYNLTVLEDRDFSADYDFVFKNGTWSNDPATASSSDNLYVYNGIANLDNAISANNLEISPWADVNANEVLELANELRVQTGGVFTFKSYLSGSGQLKSGTVVGDVQVERYIPAQTNNRRAFRFVASPVNSTAPIYANWQENGVSTIEKFGTHITGSDSGLNGFDQTTTGNPSMFLFDEGSWGTIQDTDNTQLEVGKGYRLLVRGDRRHDLTSNPVNDPNSDVILRAKGEMLSDNLTTGVELPALSTASNGFSFVGNPYQAIVNMDLVDKTGLLDYIYVWDPNMSTRGAYVVVEISSNTIAFPDPSTSEASKFVAPGQSFFVRNVTDTEPISSSLTFTESNKATTEAEVEVFSTYADFYINSRLYKTTDLVSGNIESDAIGLRFSTNFNTSFSDEDAPKTANPDENYAIINDQLLYIDNQNIPEDGHVVELLTNGYTTTEYSLTFNIGNQPENMSVLLVDSYLNTQTLLDENTTYNYSVEASIPVSMAYNRFHLIFENETLSADTFAFEDNFSLYPNPSLNGNFSIQTQGLSTDDVEIQMMNLMGQQVFAKTYQMTSNGEFHVQTEDFNTGVYVVKLIQNNQIYTQKLIIE